MATTAKQITGAEAISYIQSRVQITEPGKYTLQVISANPYENRIILGLKAQSIEGLAKAKEFLREGKFNEAANTNMSTSVYNDSSFIPAKGEHVACMVDYVENRKGEMVLGITSVSEIKARTTKKVNLGDEFDNLLDVAKDSSSDEPQLD